MTEQLGFVFPSQHGGARAGAGRPKGTRHSRRMPHARRATVSRHVPHHVTVRVVRATWNLRSQRCFAPIRAALSAVRRREGFRIAHFSVQHNHMHLVIEATDRRALSNGMRALLIRIARGLNGVMATRGRRFDDRYHEHLLKTPTEVRNALRYVLGNRFVHLARWGVRTHDVTIDVFSSMAGTDLVSPPEAWLLREGWTRAGPI